MEKTCSFQKLVCGVCDSDKRYKRSEIVLLASCQRDIEVHARSVGINDVHSEVDLILSRASVFSLPPDLSSWTICPAHRSRLGIGWRRKVNQCRVPERLASHAKKRKADRGIRKCESRYSLKHTGIFVPAGSGMYALFFFDMC